MGILLLFLSGPILLSIPGNSYGAGGGRYYDPGVYSAFHIGGNFNNMGYLELIKRKQQAFKPEAIILPSCKTYKFSKKVIPEYRWNLAEGSLLAYLYAEIIAEEASYPGVWKYAEWQRKRYKGYWVGCGPVAAGLVFYYWKMRSISYSVCMPNIVKAYSLLQKIHEEADVSFDGGTDEKHLAEGIKKPLKIMEWNLIQIINTLVLLIIFLKMKLIMVG